MPVVIDAKRSNNFYLGFAEETTPGTPVAPSVFPRWRNGTKVELDTEFEEVEEGDGSRRTTLVIKNGVKAKITYTGHLRPNELGRFEKWAMGSGSDSYTANAVNTTLSALTAVGATSITVAANTGLTGSGTIALVLEAGSSSEEVALFDIPATGGGPYTLTVNSAYNGGALRLAHSNGGTVKSSAQHVFTDQNEGNYVTAEAGFANLYSAGGTAIRIASCKVSSFKETGEHGKLLMHEIELTGIASTIQGTPATVTLEQHTPFMFSHGVHTIDGSAAGDAPNLREYSLELNNNLDDDTQTESLILSCLIFTKLDVKLAYRAILTSFSKIRRMNFGGDTGTTDSQIVGTGDFDAIFTQPNGFFTLRRKILTLAYTKAPWPEPAEDGKHWELDVEGTSVVVPPSGSGPNNAYKLQTTLTNSQYGAY